MSTFTLPSSQENHLRDKAFKRSFALSFGIHILILVVTGSVTLFRMSGTTYAPTYTVDLVTLPPSPAPSKPQAAPPAPQPAPKPAPEKPKAPEPAKKAAPPAQPPLVEKKVDEVTQAGGDEMARQERRRRIQELEQETRRLYESIKEGERGAPESGAAVQEPAPTAPAATGAPAGGRSSASDLRNRAYYDRIWSQIRAAWVIPEGVISQASLVTVVGIRISPAGDIKQSWIEKKSGNDYYDQSALRAIRKATPLPPPPEGMADGDLDVGVNFKYPE